MSDTKNVKLGVCKIFFNGVDLGYTQGGVQVSVKTETHKVNVDQFGKTTVDEVIMSRDVTAKVPLAETTMENLVAIMPGATLNVVGGVAATGGKITVTTQPVANDTVTVGGVVFTFKASAVASTDVAIGAAATNTALNLTNALIAYTGLSSDYTFSNVTSAVNVVAKRVGTYGNGLTIASSTANLTLVQMSGGVEPTSKSVDVTSGIGVSLLAIAKELRLHPLNKADSDKSEDFVIPLAATPGGMDFSYEVEKERIYNADFTGYPDPVTGKLFRVGV